MTTRERQTQTPRNRRWPTVVGGAGFLVAAGVMLAAIAFFRTGREVLWPAWSPWVHTAALAFTGTILTGTLYAVMLLIVELFAVWKGRSTWRELLRKVVVVLASVALVVVSVSVALNVFYRPWAAANAARTVSTDCEKWRLIVSAEALADDPGAESRSVVLKGLAMGPPVKAAAAYTLALEGKKAYLKVLAESARDLPVSRPDGETPSLENDISSQADVLWLLDRLTDAHAESVEGFGEYVENHYEFLIWDARKRRFSASASDQSR